MRAARYVAVAMVALAVAATGTFFFTKSLYSEVALVEKYTPAGDRQLIELPDGSKVQTNSETILLYPETFNGATRTVYLIGEANFKVKKNPDKPFIVKSGTLAVTALGTEFNIYAYPDNNDLIATLIQGKIRVDCNQGTESYMLAPSQQVIYHVSTKQSTLSEVNLQDVTAWQRGMSIFRGVRMKEILTALERRYAVKFQYNTGLFTEDKYNFCFLEKSTLEEVMAILREVVGRFDYKIAENVCYLKPSLTK